MFSNNNHDRGEGSQHDAPEEARVTTPQQLLDLHQQQLTAHDLDVEDTEAYLVQMFEEQHRQGQGSVAAYAHDLLDNYPTSPVATEPPPPPPVVVQVLLHQETRRISDLHSTTSNASNVSTAKGPRSVETAATAPQNNHNRTTARNNVPRFRRTKRAELVKRAVQKCQRQAAMAPASNLLQDIIQEDRPATVTSTGTITGTPMAGHRRATSSASTMSRGHRRTESAPIGAEPDGLFKNHNSHETNKHHEHEKDPYGAKFDHVLLKAHSMEEEEEEVTVNDPTPTNNKASKESDEFSFLTFNQWFFRRKKGAARHQSNATQQQQQSATATPDYIATTQDGYFDHTAANPSFASTTPTITTARTGGGGIRRKHWFPRWFREVCAMFHPFRVFHNCQDILVESYFLWIGVPCLVCSAVLFYLFDNPRMGLTFLPQDTTPSYWLLFMTRQTVTLSLARLTVFVVVDGIMLGTHLAVRALGPLVTLAAATGKGWPLMLSTWGIWNMVLIHGESEFQQNWLYWTEMDLFNQNYGGLMVNSVFYTRILWASIWGGLLVSAKRTIFALRFGRKQVGEFKPRLKRVLADVVLISEIATLAEQADKVVDHVDLEEDDSQASWDLMKTSLMKQNLNDLWWVPKIEYQNSDTTANENGSHSSYDETSGGHTRHASFARQHSVRSAPPADKTTSQDSDRRTLQKSDSGRLKIKDFLGRWEEPDASSHKTSVISIHDILKFRRALAHIHEENIFGDAFGCAKSRDECIASSHSVYHRLLKLAAETYIPEGENVQPGVLPFQVLALLALEEDGVCVDLAKKRKIRRLFTPDPSGGLPLVAFIQAIDQAYKRLVFLRASLRNSSLLDGVLERLFNGIFYFVLILFFASMMELNPWSFMLSITSILVSVSFALGSSVSRYVEGVLLIAVERPFDLGDRIFISAASELSPTPDCTENSWFVEDISLTTTTLRFARTNEVATVNNWSISSTRIVNLARSANATVHFKFSARLSILKGSTLEQFRRAMHKYVEDHPRVWESVKHIRHDKFDPNKESVELAIAVRHRNAWQEAGRIKVDRSHLYRFVYELGIQLDVHFLAAPAKLLYGTFQHGDGEEDWVRDTLKGSNKQS